LKFFGGLSVSVKNDEQMIAFTTLRKGMSREEMKERLIQAMLNKGIAVNGYDTWVKRNTEDDTEKR
jgi:hypothetical protein